MSQNLETLLHTAAEMRAVGHSWQAVADKVHRRVKTCQSWPAKYRFQWEKVYSNAHQKRFEEISNECTLHLNGLMRHEDPKIQLKANELCLRYMKKAIGETGSPAQLAGPNKQPLTWTRQYAARPGGSHGGDA